jgi:hypothetical protein
MKAWKMTMKENRLRTYREARGMTLTELATLSGVPLPALRGIEEYCYRPEPLIWRHITRALGLMFQVGLHRG